MVCQTKTMPKLLNQTPEELERLVESVKGSNLGEDHQSLLIGCVELATWLPSALQEKEITIENLKKALFGESTATEKKKKKKKKKKRNDKDGGDDKDDGADETNDDKAPEVTEKTNTADKSDPPDTTEAERKKGHGRLGHADYPNSIEHHLAIGQFKTGDLCPEQCGGKLYSSKPGIVIWIKGNSLGSVHKYIQDKLRCNLCGFIVKASLPDEVIPKHKYDYRFKASLSFQKYFVGVPYNRQAACQSLLDFPLPGSTQYELCESVADCGYPIITALEAVAANGTLTHQDDTHVKILSVLADNKAHPDKKRTGMYTTGLLISTEDRHQVALFYNGTAHAGERFKELMAKRDKSREKMKQMCDALAANMPKGLQVIIGNCLAHGFRKFRDLADYFPEACLYVLRELGKVYRFDEQTKGMTDLERLAYHRQHSKPVMLSLNSWLKKQLRDKLVEPNSALGQAIRYMLKHWKKLRRFLTTPGMPIDNNVVEAALKIPIRIRRGALFYKTEHGASIGGILLSLMYTAKLCGENPVEYLVAIQANKSAVFANPSAWLPWCYRDTLATLESLGKAA